MRQQLKWSRPSKGLERFKSRDCPIYLFFMGGETVKIKNISCKKELEIVMHGIHERISDPKVDTITRISAIDSTAVLVNRIEATVGGLNGDFGKVRAKFHEKVREHMVSAKDPTEQIALIDLLMDTGGESVLKQLIRSNDKLREVAKSANVLIS